MFYIVIPSTPLPRLFVIIETDSVFNMTIFFTRSFRLGLFQGTHTYFSRSFDAEKYLRTVYNSARKTRFTEHVNLKPATFTA